MTRRIKLIWDFKGADAELTAKHHCVHLEEFSKAEKLPYEEIGSNIVNDFYALAFIIVDESMMKRFRDALKPHRGVLV